ncbi:MAG: hypothetical protein V4550_13670 [Gemmatimonadota bacterium]
MRLTRLVLATPLLLSACRAAPPEAVAPPAEFVVAAGDSAFWVTSDAKGLRSRAAPIELSEVDGRYFEIYVVDDDHSFHGADLVGQSVFRRDLRTGDSIRVFTDSVVPALARAYARAHPDDHRIGPDEEPDDEPDLRATATLEVEATHGVFVSYSLHTDVERIGEPLWHMSRRGVLDLRHGSPAVLASIAGPEARAIERQRDEALKSALDSIRASHDERGVRASALLSHYRLDPTSFSITTVRGAPAVSYALPGSGTGDAGHMLPLTPILLTDPAWWPAVAATLPVASADGSRDVWQHRGYSVVVRYDESGDARLSLRDTTSREWAVGAISAPARRIFWLDQPGFDGDSRTALTKAFNEAAAYDGDSRTANGLARHLPFALDFQNAALHHRSGEPHPATGAPYRRGHRSRAPALARSGRRA